MPVTVTDLVIYPLKSAMGCSVQALELDDRGPVGDRRWMLVDADGRSIALRKVPMLCQVTASLTDEGIEIGFDNLRVDVPEPDETAESIEAHVLAGSWSVRVADSTASRALSDFLGMQCRLVWQPDEAEGADAALYGALNERERRIALTDGAPLLLASMTSLADLNARLAEPVPMYRFRPNVVIDGNEPWSEEAFRAFTIGNVPFAGVKPCPRCAATTVDHATATRTQEPLRTLATFRKVGSDVNFGMNVAHLRIGTIRVGDPVQLLD